MNARKPSARLSVIWHIHRFVLIPRYVEPGAGIKAFCPKTSSLAAQPLAVVQCVFVSKRHKIHRRLIQPTEMR